MRDELTREAQPPSRTLAQLDCTLAGPKAVFSRYWPIVPGERLLGLDPPSATVRRCDKDPQAPDPLIVACPSSLCNLYGSEDKRDTGIPWEIY